MILEERSSVGMILDTAESTKTKIIYNTMMAAEEVIANLAK